MSIINIYSKKQKELRGDIPDIYTYDILPQPLKVQIIHILNDTLGNQDQCSHSSQNNVYQVYKYIVEILCREYGRFQLTENSSRGQLKINELFNYFLEEENLDLGMDVIELCFKYINNHARKESYLRRENASKISDDAIYELNSRFKEHGLGYQFINNEIIRIDSELIHEKAVKPALKLLNKIEYEGAQQEFISAYTHYRHGKNKEALNDCLKSFESTMKAICDKHDWEIDSNANAKKLINICLEKELIPTFWQTQITSLRSMLESSIPTGRNKLSGHGQGATATNVPEYLTAYMLHMTASTLVFLTSAEQQLNS